MYNSSTYLVVTYFPNFLYLYMRLISYRIGYQGETKKLLTQMRFILIWVPNKRHPVDGALVGAGSLWPSLWPIAFFWRITGPPTSWNWEK
jgi:hypothetical protein